MGGFLGIGESSAEKAQKAQAKLAREEAEQARRDSEIAQAERTAKKGQETANIQLGAPQEEEVVEKQSGPKGPSSSLGLGGLGKKSSKKNTTGVQL